MHSGLKLLFMTVSAGCLSDRAIARQFVEVSRIHLFFIVGLIQWFIIFVNLPISYFVFKALVEPLNLLLNDGSIPKHIWKIINTKTEISY